MILAVLSAIAEPTRLEAMRLLADGSEHCVCELMRKLGATQSRMSRHMLVLKQAGLVGQLAKVVKVIKSGSISRAVKLSGIGATAGAKAAIEAAGGSVA